MYCCLFMKKKNIFVSVYFYVWREHLLNLMLIELTSSNHKCILHMMLSKCVYVVDVCVIFFKKKSCKGVFSISWIQNTKCQVIYNDEIQNSIFLWIRLVPSKMPNNFSGVDEVGKGSQAFLCFFSFEAKIQNRE